MIEKVDPALRDNIEFREFLWSGSNSLRARAVAADDLRVYLQTNFSEAPDACHLLIAHSHGGVVAFDAVARKGGTGSRQLNGILSLGTPYLAVEEDTKNKFKVLMFGLLPTAVSLFFLALLLSLAAGGFYAVAVWLVAMVIGVVMGLVVIPRNPHQPVIRSVAFMVLVLSCAGAVWGGFSAAFPCIPLWHPVGSVLGIWERVARYLCGAIAACLSSLILGASYLASFRGPRVEAFMLRDTVATVLSLGGPVIICFATIWAFISQHISSSLFATFFMLWPVISLFVAGALSQRSSSISPRWIAFWRKLSEEQETPEMPCPLDAVRLPGDEASLAIAAGLIAREVANLFAAASWSLGQLKWTRGLFWLLILGGAATGVASAAHETLGAGVPGWLVYLVEAILGAGAANLGVLIGVLFLVSFVFSFSLLTIGLLAIAIGPEVTAMLPAVRVDCEPLPRCVRTDRCRFELEWVPSEVRSRLPLRHFLHELEPVRQHVAEWINARARMASVAADN